VTTSLSVSGGLRSCVSVSVSVAVSVGVSVSVSMSDLVAV
jgi:hypothetical protein